MGVSQDAAKSHAAAAWDFWRRIGSPKFHVAPMVDQVRLLASLRATFSPGRCVILQLETGFLRRQAAWQACSCSRNACPACDTLAALLQSELAFRMLCRKYGSTAAYTPMLHSRLFLENAKYRDEHFTTCKEDRWAG